MAQSKTIVVNRSERTKFKPKAWSHQQELSDFRMERIEIMLTTVNVQGILLEADQFTLRLALRSVNGRELEMSEHSVVTYFKSAIIGYTSRIKAN